MSKPTPTETLQNIASVVTTKRSRSLIFLVITFLLILVANGLMPLISGQAKYTTEIQEVTYEEYTQMRTDNYLINLTYASKQDIKDYEEMYIKANPDLTPEQIVTITPPKDMIVSIYTKFFFQSYWWYIDTGLAMLSTVLLYYAIFNYLNTRGKDTNLNFLNGTYTMKQLNENYLDPDTFEPWTDDVFNRTRKIKQHERNIKYQLKILDKKTPYSIRKKFIQYFKSFEEAGYITNPLLPAVIGGLTNEEYKYVSKKEELLDQLRSEYIEEIVVAGDVKNFKEIKPGFVYSGVNIEGVHQDEYSAIKSDQQRIRNTMLSKILMSLAIALCFASLLTILAIDMSVQNPLWIILSTIIKTTPLVLQVYFAFNYSSWFMENQLLPNLKARENIAMMYLAEMKRQGKRSEPIILNKIELVTPEKHKKGETKDETKNIT